MSHAASKHFPAENAGGHCQKKTFQLTPARAEGLTDLGRTCWRTGRPGRRCTTLPSCTPPAPRTSGAPAVTGTRWTFEAIPFFGSGGLAPAAVALTKRLGREISLCEPWLAEKAATTELQQHFASTIARSAGDTISQLWRPPRRPARTQTAQEEASEMETESWREAAAWEETAPHHQYLGVVASAGGPLQSAAPTPQERHNEQHKPADQYLGVVASAGGPLQRAAPTPQERAAEEAAAAAAKRAAESLRLRPRTPAPQTTPAATPAPSQQAAPTALKASSSQEQRPITQPPAQQTTTATTPAAPAPTKATPATTLQQTNAATLKAHSSLEQRLFTQAPAQHTTTTAGRTAPTEAVQKEKRLEEQRPITQAPAAQAPATTPTTERRPTATAPSQYAAAASPSTVVAATPSLNTTRPAEHPPITTATPCPPQSSTKPAALDTKHAAASTTTTAEDNSTQRNKSTDIPAQPAARNPNLVAAAPWTAAARVRNVFASLGASASRIAPALAGGTPDKNAEPLPPQVSPTAAPEEEEEEENQEF